jgi:hypothetical protein
MTKRKNAHPVPSWDAVLRSLGLEPVDRGAAYRNGRLSFRVRSGWGEFETEHKADRDATPVGQFGEAGLWKPITSGRHKIARSVFELTPAVMAKAESDAGLFEALAAWALATSDGTADASWSQPSREDVEGWMPEHAMTLQVGTIARQGELHLDDGRLAFSFPVVSQVADRLPAQRRNWLQELLDDVRASWRLVRVGMAGDSTAQAEIDLTGAPAEVLEELVRTSVDALRFVVSSLAEPAEFLVNDTSGVDGCRALEISPSGRSLKTKQKDQRRKA